MKRAGGDDIFLNLNDEAVDFGYVAIGDRPNEIVIRFAETLPDDMYQLTILGTGDAPLATIGGNAFPRGRRPHHHVQPRLGAQVTAIVPAADNPRRRHRRNLAKPRHHRSLLQQ